MTTDFHPDSLRAKFLFARTFLKQPKLLGSVIPSSRRLRDRLLRMVDWNSARVIVEYGPGVGNLTSAILQRMRPDAKLVAIEMSKDFVEYLRAAFRDPRLIVVQGSAADVCDILTERQLAEADCIISGIPYSTLPPDVREQILRASYTALRPGGALVLYQFSRAVARHLRRTFGAVREQLEPRNFLPARIFFCARPQ